MKSKLEDEASNRRRISDQMRSEDDIARMKKMSDKTNLRNEQIIDKANKKEHYQRIFE